MNKDMIIDTIKAELGDVEVKFTTVAKNNVMKKGISISVPGSNIAANFYYDENKTDSEIAKDVVDGYKANIKPDFDVNDITSNMTKWYWVANRVMPVLFNITKSVYPDEIVKVNYVNDIGIIFKIIVASDDSGVASIKVTSDLLDSWNISVDELLTKAKENLNSKLYINDMGAMLFEMTGNDEFKRSITPGVMSVMTVTNKVNGASAIMCLPDIIESGEIANHDWYIIPSSTHEVILVDPSTIEVEMLNDMIRSVNSDVVSIEDYLSNDALKYDAEYKQIIVA